MIGELNASHTGVSGPPSFAMPGTYPPRHLGFEVTPSGGGDTVSHIYRDGPADQEWIDLKVGDQVLAIDGTRINANASRYQTWTAAKVETALAELDALFERMMAEADQADAATQEGLFPAEGGRHLPGELANLERRREKLRELQSCLQALDESRRKAGKDPQKSFRLNPEYGIYMGHQSDNGGECANNN